MSHQEFDVRILRTRSRIRACSTETEDHGRDLRVGTRVWERTPHQQKKIFEVLPRGVETLTHRCVAETAVQKL